MTSYLPMDATQIGFDPTIRWSPDGTVEEVFDPTAYYATDNPPYPFLYLPVSLDDASAEPSEAHSLDILRPHH